MVDRERRTLLADAIHGLLGGFLSNYEFEEWLETHDFPVFRHPSAYQDAAIGPIVEWAWCLYGDQREYRLVGRNRLNRQYRRDVVRWILFLRSGLEYEWPECRFINPAFLSLSGCLFFLVTLGIGPRIIGRRQFAAWSASGDFSVWPFLRWCDYEVEHRAVCPFVGVPPVAM